MRRMLVGLAVTAVVLSACSDERVGGGLVYLDTGEGFAAVDLAQHRVAFRAESGVATPDWSMLFRVTSAASETTVDAVETPTGDTRWSTTLAGSGLVPRVAAPDGRAVILMAPVRAVGGYPEGRNITTMVVVHRDGPPQVRTLDGNYEPEAFSSDGTTVFVVEYLPPQAPDHYRVRQVDLASGVVSAVASPDKHLQETMRGTARTQAMAPDGSRLYTLYTLEVPQPDGTTDRLAFVHVLDLAGKWAHCIDLPRGFAGGGDEATTLAVSPDGRHVFAASSTTGEVADVDTRALRVTRTVRAPLVRDQKVSAAGLRDGGVVIGTGDRVVALDASLRPAQTWRFDSTVTGVRPAGSSSVYTSLKHSLAVLRPGRSAVRKVALPIEGAVLSVGRTTGSLSDIPPDFHCAC